MTAYPQQPDVGSIPISLLRYSIHSCSSVSGQYYPTNVLVDSPEDSSSRWAGMYIGTPTLHLPSVSGASLPSSLVDFAARWNEESSIGNRLKNRQNDTSNWLMIKLDNTSILRTITFGKYSQRHPCTVKDFVVLAGQSPSHLKEILRGSLKHDATPERFSVAFKEAGDDGLPSPTLYIKVVVLSAQMANYNAALWYIALEGVEDEAIVGPLVRQHAQAVQTRTILLTLKHLRQSLLLPAYQALLSSLPASPSQPFQLEHPLLSHLHSILVTNFSLPACEALVDQLAASGLFDEFCRAQGVRSYWRRLTDGGNKCGKSEPSRRGGHQMVFDRGSEGETRRREEGIWLFGGWDGEKNWGDLWRWTRSGGWEQEESSQESPEARSCHSMVIDEEVGKLYVMGRYLETREAQGTNDFWSFEMDSRKWTRLCEDTSLMGGPSLLYDHQMILDSATQTIYSYGGTRSDDSYSGLYSYSIPSGTWTNLFGGSERGLISRTGHSLLWDPRRSCLYIFGGARNSDYFSDFWSFHPESDTLICLDPNYSSSHSSSRSKRPGPEPSFTQRSTLVLSPSSANEDKILLLSGLIRESGGPRVKSELWEMGIESGEWRRIAGLGEGIGEDAAMGTRKGHHRVREAAEMHRWAAKGGSSLAGEPEPIPRFAHQFVYDPSSSSFFCFGGNRGVASDQSAVHERLSDFWEMRLEQYATDEVKRLCHLALRQLSYLELCETAPAMTALIFLQTQLNAVVAHEDPEESSMYQSLLSRLLSKPPQTSLGETEVAGAGSRSPSPLGQQSPPSLDLFQVEDLELRDQLHRQRREVWDRILSFMPPSQKEPEQDLALLVDGAVGIARV